MFEDSYQNHDLTFDLRSKIVYIRCINMINSFCLSICCLVCSSSRSCGFKVFRVQNEDVNIRQPSLVTLERYRSGKIQSRGFTPLYLGVWKCRIQWCVTLKLTTCQPTKLFNRFPGDSKVHLIGDILVFLDSRLLEKARHNFK